MQTHTPTDIIRFGDSRSKYPLVFVPASELDRDATDQEVRAAINDAEGIE